MPLTDKEKRKLWREHHNQHSAVAQEWAKRSYCYPPPEFPRAPDCLVGLACGARTRAGTPCKLTSIYLSGRCKWHGGCSTGPKTDKGKAQMRINGLKGGRPKSKPES